MSTTTQHSEAGKYAQAAQAAAARLAYGKAPGVLLAFTKPSKDSKQ